MYRNQGKHFDTVLSILHCPMVSGCVSLSNEGACSATVTLRSYVVRGLELHVSPVQENHILASVGHKLEQQYREKRVATHFTSFVDIASGLSSVKSCSLHTVFHDLSLASQDLESSLAQ